MRNLWTCIERMNWQADTKYRAALMILGTLYALVGFAVWLVVRIWTLSTWDWMVCFIGYPVFISWLVVSLYSFNHDFHDGKHCR